MGSFTGSANLRRGGRGRKNRSLVRSVTHIKHFPPTHEKWIHHKILDNPTALLPHRRGGRTEEPAGITTVIMIIIRGCISSFSAAHLLRSDHSWWFLHFEQIHQCCAGLEVLQSKLRRTALNSCRKRLRFRIQRMISNSHRAFVAVKKNTLPPSFYTLKRKTYGIEKTKKNMSSKCCSYLYLICMVTICSRFWHYCKSLNNDRWRRTDLGAPSWTLSVSPVESEFVKHGANEIKPRSHQTEIFPCTETLSVPRLECLSIHQSVLIQGSAVIDHPDAQGVPFGVRQRRTRV